MNAREVDIVLYGATGFVGQLTARHLATQAPQGVTVALAGRDRAKVERVRSRLGSAAQDWPVIIADATDAESLAAMARQARVVISTVGPYASYGLPLVRACAQEGTDYVDLTGEVLFVRESIDSCDALARQTGARIVHACGFDSVPSDLAVLRAAEQARADGTGTLTETTGYMTMRGGFSGGTIASARGQIEQVRREPARAKVLKDPYALSPDREAEPSARGTSSAVRYAAEVSSWVAPFVMAPFNTRIVRRSNALAGHAYGRGLQYGEVVRTGDGMQGRATGYAVAAGLGAGLVAMSRPFLGPLVDRIVPAPGEGPSERTQALGFFRMDVHASTESGAQYVSTVAAQGDPGYAATSVMLGESALCLALERDRCPLPDGRDGGVLTPATALGEVLVERLSAQGFTCEVRRSDS